MAELERSLAGAEDYLRRQLGSRAAREASKRKLKRGAAEAYRRVRRAGFLFVGLIFALVLVDIGGASIGFFTWLFALFGIVLASVLSLTLPTFRRRHRLTLNAASLSGIPLPTLAERAERWLLDRCPDLPRTALPAADRILARLQSLQPALAGLPHGAPVTAELRQLVGAHLPNLVDTYLALPPERRGAGSENDRRVSESLAVVAEELTRLCSEIDGCRESLFEVEHRFIESRYSEDGPGGQ